VAQEKVLALARRMLFGVDDKLTFIAGSIVTHPGSPSDNGLSQFNT